MPSGRSRRARGWRSRWCNLPAGAAGKASESGEGGSDAVAEDGPAAGRSPARTGRGGISRGRRDLRPVDLRKLLRQPVRRFRILVLPSRDPLAGPGCPGRRQPWVGNDAGIRRPGGRWRPEQLRRFAPGGLPELLRDGKHANADPRRAGLDGRRISARPIGRTGRDRGALPRVWPESHRRALGADSVRSLRRARHFFRSVRSGGHFRPPGVHAAPLDLRNQYRPPAVRHAGGARSLGHSRAGNARAGLRRARRIRLIARHPAARALAVVAGRSFHRGWQSLPEVLVGSTRCGSLPRGTDSAPFQRSRKERPWDCSIR